MQSDTTICPCCELSSANAPWHTIRSHGTSLYRCPCGFVYKPLPTSYESLNKSATGDGFISIREDKKELLQSRVKALEAVIAKMPSRPKRLLEIGPGTGAYLVAAEKLGIEAVGVEFSENLCEYLRQNTRAEIRHGRIVDFPDLEGSFDLIIMGHVVEHMPDPLPELKQAIEALSPGGALYLRTPNLKSLIARLTGRLWAPFYVPDHVSFWSGPTLRTSLHSLGMKQVTFWTNESKADLFQHCIGSLSAWLARNKSPKERDTECPEKQSKKRLRPRRTEELAKAMSWTYRWIIKGMGLGSELNVLGFRD